MGLFVKNKKDENFEIKKSILEEIKKRLAGRAAEYLMFQDD